MKACGLIVEYNPFHNGHRYHIEKAKEASKADCMIAIMSGSFLQRGEPAIIDKFHRAKAALEAGVDIVLELPFVYAVQNSDIFANGAVKSLHEIGVNSICFGSESGNISFFLHAYEKYKEKEPFYKETLRKMLDQGLSFPEASRYAYESIGLTANEIDLSQPNNILGYSYVKTILDNQFQVEPLTIKRTKNNYHDEEITNPIASATSIRKEIFTNRRITEKVSITMPEGTNQQLKTYKEKSTTLHEWEGYFPLLHYRVMTMSHEELAGIHGINEGLEYRIKKTAKQATSINEWIEMIKTKRYTRTRLQRIFVHILTNTKKNDIEKLINKTPVPYIRILGITKTGQNYLNMNKKTIDVPLLFRFNRNPHPMMELEENASNAYYSILPPHSRKMLFKQELGSPIIVKE
ncbi:nucleotidyltransferase [Oceanobacillus bengalensis]|uniref:tRNA(Met) cytidine acetate ligase n=1 Tax=Oceanobacillus bengalensis TaxID=1435466 RepID=A0A494Z1C3_9BACI|nr:nucleotidyltransferase [Oceanobacillus bengalensis]RKQ16322.1 nucleotidyltransferase [Oceanobacillus bengalensis]